MTLPFSVVADGSVNSLRLNSVSVLTSTIRLADSPMLNAPVVMPLAERMVRVGEQVCLRIAYRFGGGFEHFSAAWD